MKKTTLLTALCTLALVAIPGAVFAQATTATSKAACHGKLFNPVSDPDWNNLFPFSLVGFHAGGNMDPPEMYEPPVCFCPSYLFGYPVIGAGIMYWEPTFISEVVKIAGCAPSLNGTSLVGTGYMGLNSEQSQMHPDTKGGPHSSRQQVHFYQYPVLSVVNLFSDVGCRNMGGFSLLWASELDPTWQNDIWAGIFNPEATLFGGLEAQFACMVDSTVVSADMPPVDSLFWCAGTWGGLYPMAGTANQSTSTFQMNHLTLAKFLARQTRVGGLMQTIGPGAICNSTFNPVWLKGQFRVNEVWPLIRKGSPMWVGSPPIYQMPPMITNLPGLDDSVDLIWEGKQCCLRD
jgi:conjugal transfer pilus assembly protein TraU